MLVLKQKDEDGNQVVHTPVYPEEFEAAKTAYQRFTIRQRQTYKAAREKGWPKYLCFQAAEGVGKDYVILK